MIKSAEDLPADFGKINGEGHPDSVIANTARNAAIDECAKKLEAMKIKTADADAGGGYRYNQILDSAIASIRSLSTSMPS